MHLDRVTITGADDSIKPESLLDYSLRFPFVEWGILSSLNNSADGVRRYPSIRWIDEFQEMKQGRGIRSALHINGAWVRQLLKGDNIIPEYLLEGFDRLQLNFHAEGAKVDRAGFYREVRAILENTGIDQVILQIDGVDGNIHLANLLADSAADPREPLDVVPLYDTSAGRGVLPEHWPVPMYRSHDPSQPGPMVYHGYAGGLGPDNLRDELVRIDAAAGDCRVWVDMETRVRSHDDQLFDFQLVDRALMLCEPHVRALEGD